MPRPWFKCERCSCFTNVEGRPCPNCGGETYPWKYEGEEARRGASSSQGPGLSSTKMSNL